jgi:hypothetical protein
MTMSEERFNQLYQEIVQLFEHTALAQLRRGRKPLPQLNDEIAQLLEERREMDASRAPRRVTHNPPPTEEETRRRAVESLERAKAVLLEIIHDAKDKDE